MKEKQYEKAAEHKVHVYCVCILSFYDKIYRLLFLFNIANIIVEILRMYWYLDPRVR